MDDEYFLDEYNDNEYNDNEYNDDGDENEYDENKENDEFDYDDEKEETVENENYEYEQYDMIDERGAYERTSNMLMNVAIQGDMKQFIRNLSDEDKFKLKVQSYLEEFKIQKSNLLEKIIDAIPQIKYKNAYCFLIGFSCIKNNKIDKTALKKKYDDEQIFSIKLPDKLRYSRMILDIMENLK